LHLFRTLKRGFWFSPISFFSLLDWTVNLPQSLDAEPADLDESALYSLLLQTYGHDESNVEVTLQLQPEGSNDSIMEDEEETTAETDQEDDGDASQNAVPDKAKRKLSDDAENNRRPLYSCNRCQRIYTKKHSVLRHLRYECGVEPQFQCSICPQRFKHRSDQQRHERKIHGVEGVFDDYATTTSALSDVDNPSP